MIHTKNYNFEEAKELIKEAVNEIMIPIAQTMSPMGGNVLFESDGKPIISNDGYTISRQIEPKDRLKSLIVDVIREASDSTNADSGDAKSTTILLTGKLILESIKLMENGTSHNHIVQSLHSIKKDVLEGLSGARIAVETDDDLRKVAFISANNNEEIANNVVDMALTAGEDGIVKFELSKDNKTKLEKQIGYILANGIVGAEFIKTIPDNAGLLLTTNKIYHDSDVNEIVAGAKREGIEHLVVVAKDFIGNSKLLISKINSMGDIFITPIKNISNDDEVIRDMGVFLGVDVYEANKGKFENINKQYYGSTGSVQMSPQVIIFEGVVDKRCDTKERIKEIKKLIDVDKTDALSLRLASLTSGVVTLHVGGETKIEKEELRMRYNDALRAVMKAKEHGYLPGAGVGLREAAKNINGHKDLSDIIAFSVQNQILSNCVSTQTDSSGNIGYNALTGEWCDVLEAGIYDSYLSIENAVNNSISATIALVSAMSNTIIIKDFNE